MNGHFAAVGSLPTAQHYENGIQVIDEDKAFKCVLSFFFPLLICASRAVIRSARRVAVGKKKKKKTDRARSANLNDYLNETQVAQAGFNYHLISVFGSQSTGKSTLLNHLFGTKFSVMSETERRQTTKGIWLSKNKKDAVANGTTDAADSAAAAAMADNILVMDVEGTDGRERGEDQDFERKSALFALATSEVLIVNIWEHQVGLYQGANMGLLKTVFEVNLQLFLKDRQ